MVMKASNTFQDLLLADLRRAQNLITKVHPDPIDPQFRIATPEGDYWIAITLTENAKERTRRLALVSDFMAYKLSFGFTLASEMYEPDSVMAVGVIRDEVDAVISLIDRTPKLGTALAFSAPKRVLRENIDPTILALRPRGSRTITSAREKELLQWFGPQGKFPAVALDRDGRIPR
ncbi:hypothetical protein [Ralstonia sp.]|uniref:hypothetical protein n=1 Tax=Ralstonia sp. TaxID=54061 RepID=UPI002580BAC7|nr:hypothetical protein [Ralstonia sp.]